MVTFVGDHVVALERVNPPELTFLDLESGSRTSATARPNTGVRERWDREGKQRLIRMTEGSVADRFMVVDSDGRMIYETRAIAAALAGAGELLIAVQPTPDVPWADVFTIEVVTQSRELIATAMLSSPVLPGGQLSPVPSRLLPLDGNARLVVWTEKYCSAEAAVVVLDRRSGV